MRRLSSKSWIRCHFSFVNGDSSLLINNVMMLVPSIANYPRFRVLVKDYCHLLYITNVMVGASNMHHAFLNL